MSPEAKEVLDYLLAFAGPGAAGGVALAFFGWLKARNERPAHIAAPEPSIGHAGLAQIGGYVMGQQTEREFFDALRAIAASHDRCTLARETEMETRKKLAVERREHERDLARERHEEWRQITDVLRTLSDRIREHRP